MHCISWEDSVKLYFPLEGMINYFAVSWKLLKKKQKRVKYVLKGTVGRTRRNQDGRDDIEGE